MKLYIKSSNNEWKSPADDWSSFVDELVKDNELYGNPIYEGTEAGEELASICGQVGDSMGVWLKFPAQNGSDDAAIYDMDGNVVAYGIDLEVFDDDCFNIAVDSLSKAAFKRNYRNYLKSIIKA